MKGKRNQTVDKTLSNLRTDVDLLASALKLSLNTLETVTKILMTNYDKDLPRIYGKDVDASDLGDCPNCMGKCELAGGLEQCECTFCGTDAPEPKSYIAE